MLLKRRPRQRSGILRVPERSFPAHRQWIRGHLCLIADQHRCRGRIEPAHMDKEVPYVDAGGTSLKSRDCWVFPLCHHGHFDEYHRLGHDEFQRKYNVDIKAACERLARRSPSLRKAEREAQRVRT